MDIKKINQELSKKINTIFFEYKGCYFKLSNEDIFIPPAKQVIIPEGADKFLDEKEWETIPYCCSDCEEIFNALTIKHSKFPNCCETHIRCSKEPWFKEENYVEFPFRILNQLHLSIYEINYQHIQKGGLYKIIEYIDYSVFTFGIPSVGSEFYVAMLYKMLELNKSKHLKIEDDAIRVELMKVLSGKMAAVNSGNDVSTNFKQRFDLLFQIYSKWIEIFPKLSFYENFKEDALINFVDVFAYNPQYNEYSELTKFQLHSPIELLQRLPELTNRMLSAFDTKLLIEKEVENNEYSYRKSLVNEAHRVKQKQLVGNLNASEKEFTSIMYQWLENEKGYYLEKEEEYQKYKNKRKQNIAKKATHQPKFTQKQIALYYRYLVLAQLSDPITTNNMNEIAAKFNYTSPTSGQKICAKFNNLNNPTQRTAKGKYTIRDLEVVIKYLEPYPKAKNRAEDELKMAKSYNS